MIVEAVLFAATDPVSHEQLLGLIGQKVSKKQVANALSSLWEQYEKADGALQIVEIGGGFKMTTRAQLAPWIEKFFTKIYVPIGQEDKLALPLDEAIPEQKRLFTGGELFLVKPSRQSWVGLLITLGICLACVLVMLMILK